MATVKAQKVPKKQGSALEFLSALCYYYPQYTLKQARALPYKDAVLLMKVAQRMEARKLYELTQIAAAPHTKKGVGVKKLLAAYGKVAKGD